MSFPQVVKVNVTGARGIQGIPGGSNATYANLATVAASTVATGTNLIWTDNGNSYIYDAAVDAAYVTANPLTSVRDLAGRGFRNVIGESGGASRIGASDASSGTKYTTIQGFLTYLLSSVGSSIVGFIQSGAGAVSRTAQSKMRETLTPQDFGGVGDGVTNDTAAFAALAVQYNLGRSVHIPAGDWLIDADTALFTPPASYNFSNTRPPAITADPASIIRARTSGTFLVQIGTIASDYSGFLRNPRFVFGILHDGGKTFTKAVLYMPFFIDIHIEYQIQITAAVRAAWFGDSSAPASSAGVKGSRNYTRDLNAGLRQVQSITNGVNPTVTFAAPHGLWPSSGNRVICINFGGTLGAWANINNTGLDCTILSSTQVQLKNVDTTSYGSLPGAANAYLNFASSRVPKQISGVTNANPCVITTAIPHLFTSGDVVDIAEIFGMPRLIGQYTATVTGANTFSIPLNTSSTATWGSWGSFGPGWAMQWVPFDQCDIAEYHDRSTDIDDLSFYSSHFRIHQYHNPATCGFDGKKNAGHAYNFPEAGETLCMYYLNGDNNCVQVQIDGPFRYVFWAVGPRNFSTNCSTNVGIGARPSYGALVRTEAGAGWTSYGDRLKSNSGALRIFSEHVGLGAFACRDTVYVNVSAPAVEFGTGNRASSVRFAGATGAVAKSFQLGSVSRSSAGTYIVNFGRAVPLDCYVEASVSGPSGILLREDETYGSRSVFSRRYITEVGTTATDATTVSLVFRYS